MKAKAQRDEREGALSLLEALLGVHTAPSVAWLAEAAGTAAERGLGALYALVYLSDGSGGLAGERPPSRGRERAQARLRDALGAEVPTLKFTPAAGSLVAKALESGAAAATKALSDVLPLSTRAQQAQRRLGADEVWLAPLRGESESAGLLVLLMPAGPASTLAEAELLARHVAVALQNLREKEAVRKRGELDAVRWVYDEWRFLEELSQEARRAQRHGRPLSLLLLRVQNLQELHERYGRFLAERVLRQVAARLADAMRETDFLGASGDDGFAAILVEADRQGAARAEERLLAGLDALQIPNAELPDLRIQLAYGTATLPDDGLDAEELMGIAESRLGAATTTDLDLASA